MKGLNSNQTAFLFAFTNAAVATLVLQSPLGGDGAYGVIGYSIFRLLIVIVIHAPLTFGGLVASYLSFDRKLDWPLPLILTVGVPAGIVWLYFS